MKILVTGAAGMIGSHLVNELNKNSFETINLDVKEKNGITVCDLGDRAKLDSIVKIEKPDRIIHLAALAHTLGGKKYPDELYYHLNVECANNVFQVANENNVPVLFISTVDVFGFQKDIVNSDTVCNPVTVYGKTKYQAEQLLKVSGARYTILRFSPVYTADIKRDIQKRYYLKFPNLAYQIGKGTEYEILNIENAIQEMIDWCAEEPQNTVKIVKDKNRMWTPDYISAEKAEGRAKFVLKLPTWMAKFGYAVLKGITGENKYTYLLNKAVHPLRSE